MRQLKSMAAVGGAVVLIGVWPLAVGHIGQTVLTDAIENASNQDVSVELVEYDRGYLTSMATTKVTVVDPFAIAQFESYGWPTQYEFVHDISHGMVSLTGKTHYVETPQIVLETQTQLNGNTEFKSHTPAHQFDVEGADPMSVLLSPLSLEGSLTVLGKVQYQFEMPSLELDFQNGTVIRLNSLQSSGDGKIDEGLWVGNQSVVLNGFSVSDSERISVIDMQGMKYQFNTSEDETNQILQGDYQLNVDSVKNVDGEAENLMLNFTAGGLDKAAFLSLSKIYQNSPVWTDQDTRNAIPHLDALLSKGFFLTLNQFSVDVDHGSFESNWDLRLPEGEGNTIQDVLKLLELLQGQMSAFISSDLVMAYPFIQENLDELLLMDIAVQTDEGYALTIKLEKGQVEFANGKQVPLMAILLPMLMPQER